MKNSTRISNGGNTINFKGSHARAAFEGITGRKIPRPEDVLNAVTEFNEANPVGTAVNVRKDNGDIFRTVTRSAAWVMGGHTAMVLVEGISGGYMLERVTPQKGGAS